MRSKKRQANISATLFLSGLALVIGQAGASDIGISLASVITGVLIGIVLMVAGAYGLWLEDIKKEAAPTKRNGARTIHINYKERDVDCQ